MNITSFLGIPRGHKGLAFVDIQTDDDTQLFLDPCLIERGTDDLSRQAALLMTDFTYQLYADMRSGRWYTTHVFNEAHEIHDTKLGYGNGGNGKGKTPHGMRESLNGLCELANSIPSISCIQDISVFVEDFAEDCMSDLLSNVLRSLLCQFTAEQMGAYGKRPDGQYEVKSWDYRTHGWISSIQPYWMIEGKKILLVPKWWVRKHFLFRAHQYLYGVIIEHMQEEFGYEGLTKKDVWHNMKRESEHWEYDKVIDYTRSNPGALDEYHRRIPQYYNRANGCMDDDNLDISVYGYRIVETA
ncbi:MAG: hypothetical protein ACLSB9_22835 [Hydrogeniiclostridium mannosilyticum]